MTCDCDYCRQDRAMGDRYHARIASESRTDRLLVICIPCLCLLAAFGIAVSWWVSQ